MMASVKSGKKSTGNSLIVCIFLIAVFILVPLIHSQKAYAERKKVSGTVKERTDDRTA